MGASAAPTSLHGVCSTFMMEARTPFGDGPSSGGSGPNGGSWPSGDSWPNGGSWPNGDSGPNGGSWPNGCAGVTLCSNEVASLASCAAAAAEMSDTSVESDSEKERESCFVGVSCTR